MAGERIEWLIAIAVRVLMLLLAVSVLSQFIALKLRCDALGFGAGCAKVLGVP